MITNTANKTEASAEVNRAQIEHRATWMGLIYDEMVKEGIDAERIIRKAIKRCGNIHGAHIKEKCADPQDCTDFKGAFLNDLVINTFIMQPHDVDKDNLHIDFHYCALVTAWQKLGFDDKTCELLCDMAMDGDRGIAEALGLKLSLGETIAKGCAECKLHFHK